MPSISFDLVYGKNGDLLFSTSEIIEQYLHGIPLCLPDGSKPSMRSLEEKIRIAQTQVERLLNIKLWRQEVTETRDFIKTDYNAWGYLKVTYPVREILDFTGMISTTKQVEFPTTWLSSWFTDQEDLFYRVIHIVPAGSNTPHTNSVVFVGITPFVGFYGVPSIPNYWRVKYCTGFKKIPADLRDVVGKLAAMQILAIIGDVYLNPGITSSSLSLDGLSQSISTTRSGQGGVFAGRIKQYGDEIKASLLEMKDWYKGLNFITC